MIRLCYAINRRIAQHLYKHTSMFINKIMHCKGNSSLKI